jgi:sigma-E factor negative regulatory protein RseB
MGARASSKHILAGRVVAVLSLLGAATWAGAQTPPSAAAPQQAGAGAGKGAERSISDWLMRMHQASRVRSYIGTFVVSSNAGSLASARIWHACEGDSQAERVESLTGAPRSTFRRNEDVVTFLPERRVVRTERQEPLATFPNLLQATDSSIPEFYGARQVGSDRVAGFDADVVQLEPRDNLRFGYRIWSEKRSGLVIKLQTLDADGRVLEQTAFSELALDAPVSMEKISRMMAAPPGWRVEKVDASKTSAAAEGWQLKAPVAGFKPVSCYRRPGAGAPTPAGMVQWIFSDGLAAVSLFVEPYDRVRHVQEGLFATGATQTLTQRIQEWWLTAVGEVPAQTLKAFAANLERRN